MGVAEIGGTLRRGKVLHQQGPAFAAQLNHLITQGVLEQLSGIFHVMWGISRQRPMTSGNALRCYEQAKLLFSWGSVRAWLGYSKYMSGNSQGALELIEEGCKFHESLGMPLWLSLIYMCLGEVRFLTGDTEAGKAELTKGVDLALENHESFFEGSGANPAWNAARQV